MFYILEENRCLAKVDGSPTEIAACHNYWKIIVESRKVSIYLHYLISPKMKFLFQKGVE
jgi:hypothetical protein